MEQIKKNAVVRDSNIELLRILAILGVIVLHYNNANMGGGLKYVPVGSLKYYLLYLLETIFICGVNVFVLISGYFMSASQKRSIVKPLQLLIQVIVFNVLISAIGWITHHTFSIKNLISALIPVNYFVILYIALYFVSPYINVALTTVSQKSLKYMVVICFCIFSIWPTIVDTVQHIAQTEYKGLSTIGMYGSQWGYSIVNFMLMYMIGGYIRVKELKNENKQTGFSVLKLLVVLFFVVALILI